MPGPRRFAFLFVCQAGDLEIEALEAVGAPPFEERGRVTDPDGGGHLTGVYAVGWIKRGPTGILGTNKRDAEETIIGVVRPWEMNPRLRQQG